MTVILNHTEECKISNLRGVISPLYIGVTASLFISMTTCWRILFNKYIGKPCGRYYASIQCGKLKKPSLIIQNDANHQNQWKLHSLNYFYKNNISQLKKSKITESKIKLHCNDDEKGKNEEREENEENEGNEENQESMNKQLKFLKNSLNCSRSEIVDYFQYLYKTKKYDEYCYKFSEEFWKCMTMLFLTIYGCIVIYDADYFYDTKLFYIEWPQKYNEAMELYYKLSVGYHGHRVLWQVFDTKRKDFWAMTIHHNVTVALIIGSWYLGVMQFGCVVMFCHDNCDFLLATAKICRYNEWEQLTNLFYGLFVLSWIIFRICLFSWKILYSLLIESTTIYDCHWLYTLFVSKLIILLLLHFYWLRMILAVAIKAFMKKKTIKDVRSDDED